MDARQTARIEPLVVRDITQRGRLIPLTAPSLGVFNYKSVKLGDGSYAISYFTYGEKVSANRTGYTNAMNLSAVGITQDIGTGREMQRLLLVVEIRKSEQLKNIDVHTRQENGYHFEADVRRPFYMCTIFENIELTEDNPVHERMRIKSKIDLHYVRNPQTPQNEPTGATPVAPNIYLSYNVHIRYNDYVRVIANDQRTVNSNIAGARVTIGDSPRGRLLYPTDPWDEAIDGTGRKKYSGKRRDALSRCGVIAFKASVGSTSSLELITRGHANRDDVPAFLDFPAATDSDKPVSKQTPFGGMWFRGVRDLKTELGGPNAGPCLIYAVATMRTTGDESAGRDYIGTYKDQSATPQDGYVAYFAIPLNDPDILRPYTFFSSPIKGDSIKPKWERMELDARGRAYLDISGKLALTIGREGSFFRAYFLYTLYHSYLSEDTIFMNEEHDEDVSADESGVARYHIPFDIDPPEPSTVRVDNRSTYTTAGRGPDGPSFMSNLFIEFDRDLPTSTPYEYFDRRTEDAIVYFKDVQVNYRTSKVVFEATVVRVKMNYRDRRVVSEIWRLFNKEGSGDYFRRIDTERRSLNGSSNDTIEIGGPANVPHVSSVYRRDPAYTVLYLGRDSVYCLPKGALVWKGESSGVSIREPSANPGEEVAACPPEVRVVPPEGQNQPFIDTDVFEFEYGPCPNRVHQHHRPNPLIDCVITESNTIDFEWRPLYRYYPEWLRQSGVTDNSKGCLPSGKTVSICLPPPCGELTSLYSQSQRGLGGIVVGPKILDSLLGDAVDIQHYEFEASSGTLTFRSTLPAGSYDIVMQAYKNGSYVDDMKMTIDISSDPACLVGAGIPPTTGPVTYGDWIKGAVGPGIAQDKVKKVTSIRTTSVDSTELCGILSEYDPNTGRGAVSRLTGLIIRGFEGLVPGAYYGYDTNSQLHRITGDIAGARITVFAVAVSESELRLLTTNDVFATYSPRDFDFKPPPEDEE